MNNSSRNRERIRGARDLTAEIDRATDLMEMNRRVQGDSVDVAERERAQQVGWRVIDGGRHGMEGDADGAERSTPAGELVRDELELTRPVEFVGEESNLQARERLADDLEDARNEAGEGLKFENRIVAKNQEGVARAITPEVDKLVGQKSFRVSDLERIYRHGVNTTLGVFGRRIGDRN